MRQFRLLAFSVGLLILAASAPAQDVEDTLAVAPVEADSLSRWVPNDSFGLGEYLKFSLGYGFVSAGYATLSIPDTVTYNGNLCYRILNETASNSFVDKFYKVRDTSFSYMDADGLFAHYFRKSLNEGSYHSHREVEFDYDAMEARYRKDAEKVDTNAIVPFAQDILSAMYYLRTQKLEVGDTWTIPTVPGDTLTNLLVKVLGREAVDVPAGEFNCLILEPLLSATGIFRHEGQIKVWVTDDRLHLPVLMKSKVLVGSIYAELEEFRLGNLDW